MASSSGIFIQQATLETVLAEMQVALSTNIRSELHKVATAYSPLPQTFVSAHTRKDGMLSFGWGRSNVLLNNAQNAVKTKHRLIRLRFAVGFAKKILPGKVRISPLPTRL